MIWGSGDLNPEQEAAIASSESVFLVACPGSGKTRTLTYKIADQLSKLESDKAWVVAITYTHRAADEISERVERLGVDTSRLWIGTIHAFCLEWILRPYGIYHPALQNGFRVINSHESEDLLTELCRSRQNPRVGFYDCAFHFTSCGYVLSCDQFKQVNVSAVLTEYFFTLSERRQIDFELILYYAYELIAKNPSIPKILGSIFTSVLVDEYQDTREIQYLIIASILKASGGQTSTFIVGDPNQAIYGSLGGYAVTPEQFRVMSGVQLVEMGLSKNYRSSSRIVEYFGKYNVLSAAITAEGEHKDYPSLVTFDTVTPRDGLDDELVRLIRYNIEELNIPPDEICIIAPWWIHLASMTRRLVTALPEYSFDGPGMVPFARDPDNFWYKSSKLVLTQPSPSMYVRRLRWAAEVIAALDTAGLDVAGLSTKALLRECNSLDITDLDGLTYLTLSFDALFTRLGLDYRTVPTLMEHHKSFFESSRSRIDRLRNEGGDYIASVETFRRVFEERSGITVSTIHGVKGAEFDTVIACALLQGIVPHFNDPDGRNSAYKLLYVIGSRARKNLHLIAESGRRKGNGDIYMTTSVLRDCVFAYNPLP